jgi:hypothetical protein
VFLVALKYLLWGVSPCLQASLAGVMVKRKLHREYGVFLAYTVSHIVRFVVLSYVHLQGKQEAYRYTYFYAEAVDGALSFAVIYEVYWHLLREYSGVQKLVGMVFRCAAVVLLALAVLTAAASPAEADTSRVLAGLFTFDRAVSIIRGGLLLLLFLFASYFGLRWKHFAFGIVAGFAVETSVGLATFTLRAHLGVLGKPMLSLISSAAYDCAVLVWVAYLFSPEPAARPAKLPPGVELEGWNQALLELLHQ